MMHHSIYQHPHVEAVAQLHKAILAQPKNDLRLLDYLEQMALNLHKAHQDKHLACTVQISNWFTPLIGKSQKRILDYPFQEGDARQTIAREYGFTYWEEVLALKHTTFKPHFEQAIDAVLSGDLEHLAQSLKEQPNLVQQTSPFGHRATLLHYTASNGVETHRQCVPRNLLAVVQLLLQKGCDKQAKMKVYGGAYTAAELAATSAHPFDFGIGEELVNLLL